MCNTHTIMIICLNWDYNQKKITWRWIREFIPLKPAKLIDGPYNITGCFHPTKDLFVAGGPTTTIRGYTMANAYYNQDDSSGRVYATGSRIKWEHNLMGTYKDIDNSCFTFSVPAGPLSGFLATISKRSNVINIFTVEKVTWPPWLALTRIDTIDCRDKPMLQSLSWTKSNVLAAGSEGDNIHVFLPSKAKVGKRSWRCKLDYMNPANMNVPSEVQSVRWQLKAPMYFQLATQSGIFIQFWCFRGGNITEYTGAEAYAEYDTMQRDYIDESLHHSKSLEFGQVKALYNEFKQSNRTFSAKFAAVANASETLDKRVHSMVGVAKSMFTRFVEGKNVTEDEVKDSYKNIITMGSVEM